MNIKLNLHHMVWFLVITMIAIFPMLSTSATYSYNAQAVESAILSSQQYPSDTHALSYPSDPMADIEWSAGYGGVADIQTAFNHARTVENGQLGTTVSAMSLPAQASWNVMSDGEKALWLINRERIDRGLVPLHGIENNVMGVAQYYADYLLANDTFSHTADGKTPWQRLENNAAIGACHDFLNVAENLGVFATSGSSISLPIERSIYMWMYDDAGSNWGHRHAILWYPYNDTEPLGSEGFLGIGRAHGGPYQGPFSQPWNFAEIIVMNVFDPCASWSYSGPYVLSINRASPTDPTDAASVDFDITFSENVTGVDTSAPFSDFYVYTTGTLSGVAVSAVSGSGNYYTVTVNTGTGSGKLRLDINPSGTGIQNQASEPLNGGFAAGQYYMIARAPVIETASFFSQGSYDGWVRESSETSSMGGSKNDTSRAFIVGDDAYNQQYRGFLSFNTSSIPTNAVITKLTIKVKKAGSVGQSPFSTHKGLRVDIQKGQYGTSPKLQSSDFQATTSKNLAGRFSSVAVSDWYTADLGSAAYSLVNKGGITQFRLRFYKDDNNDFGADYFKFFSSNAATADRPQLIVEYYVQ